MTFDPEAAKAFLARFLKMSKAERAVLLHLNETPEERRARRLVERERDRADFAREEEEHREAERLRALEAPAEVVPEPEPLPVAPVEDFTDTVKWVQVHTPEVVPYVESNGDQGQTITRYVGTGRTLVTYRLRQPEDGQAVIIYAAPNIPKPPEPPKMAPHRWGENDSRGSYASVESNRRRLRADDERPRLGSRTPGSRL